MESVRLRMSCRLASAVSVVLANKAIDEGRRINFSDHIKPEQITEANKRFAGGVGCYRGNKGAG